jgi:alpha-beta hydrolase superfamily lysophospholipase
METKTVTNSKANTDAKTREMNAKAKTAAMADMKLETNHNINTGKPLTSSKPKEEPVKTKKEPVITLASKLDTIITAGGKWADIVEKANAASKELKATTKFSVGTLKGHIRYRLVKNAQYLGELAMTEAGIEKVSKSKSKK